MEVLSAVLGWVRGDGEPTEYECRDCGRGFRRRRQVCPECGGYRIERVEWAPGD